MNIYLYYLGNRLYCCAWQISVILSWGECDSQCQIDL